MKFIRKNRVKEEKALAKRQGGSGSSTTIYSGGTGGNYLPATMDENGNYVVDLAQVKFNGNIYSTGEITAFTKNETTPQKPPVQLLNDLEDVEITTLTNGQILQYDDSIKKWKNATITFEGGGTGEPTTWESIIGKPSVFAPDKHTHSVAEIPDIGSYYTSKTNFRMHTGSKSQHTTVEEKEKWNQAVIDIGQHTVDQDMHCTYDMKMKWDAVCDVLDEQSATALLSLLNNIEVTATGDIKLKNNLIVGKEITSHATTI